MAKHSIYQHISSMEIAKLSVSQSLLSSSMSDIALLVKRRIGSATPPCLGSLSRHQVLGDAWDVEQRKDTPLRLQPILCPLFQCSFGTLCYSSGCQGSHGTGALAQSDPALCGRVSRPHVSRRSSGRLSWRCLLAAREVNV
jgi:hypothetical protein